MSLELFFFMKLGTPSILRQQVEILKRSIMQMIMLDTVVSAGL